MELTIIGAGPAGLVAAIAARRLGHDATIFEQAPDFRRVGGGIGIQSNGLQVLDTLGLLDSFRPFMNHLWVGTVESPPGRVVMRADFHEAAIPHAGFAVVLRYTLLDHLLEAAKAAGAEIRFGRRCIGVTRTGVDRAVLTFDDGPEHPCGIVLGCDGTRSAARSAVRARSRVVEIGEAYLRAVAELPIPDGADMAELWGFDGRRIGMVPLTGDRTYVFCRVPLGQWDEIRQTRLSSWLASWRDFGPRAMALLEAVPDWDEVVYDELKEVHANRWYDPPIFITGDAAHAMTPNLGQGANSAMVDALVLVRLLEEGLRSGDALATIGARYERIRRRYAMRVQAAARLGGVAADWKSPLARGLRDTVFRAVNRIGPLRRRGLDLSAGYNPIERKYIE